MDVERLRRALRGTDRVATPALPVGEAMHPLTLAAVAVLVVNDWVLKAHWHNALTGKLSDVAGLAFAPVVLTAAIGLVLHAAAKLGARIDPSLSRRRLLLAIVATGTGFALVKLVPDVGDAVARAIGHGAEFYPDRTDLFTLPALVIAFYIGRDELRRVPLGRPAAVLRTGATLDDVRWAGGDPSALETALRDRDLATADAMLAR